MSEPRMREDLEHRPLPTYSLRLKQVKESKESLIEQRFAKVDAVFWNSAIFSREAMALNHVSPHKYGDQKALGIYRVVATCIMFVLFTFLTLY